MGNSATKEQKGSGSRLHSTEAGQSSVRAGSPPRSPSLPQPLDHNSSHSMYNVRTGRGSRSDLSTLLGIRSGPVPDLPTLETRRANKQEREARRLEAERAAREKERDRSMRDENVDGGYLVTQGVYTGSEDYNKGVVRQLMIERRIAPFWRGLNEHSNSWTENQLVAAARGKPIPAPDEIPEEDLKVHPTYHVENSMSDMSFNNLTLPVNSRSESFNSDTSPNMSPSQASFPPGSSASPSTSSNPGNGMFRGRSKTLAALTTSTRNPQSEIRPREMQLPKDSLISGQPLEAHLYKDASECPICFLYYPLYLNKTRCCDQAICSECFVQIKRPDPHPPEHADPAVSQLDSTEDTDPDELISEPAACPFCVQPEFGITYDPPPFRRGLTYIMHSSTHPFANAPSAMSSASSLASAQSGRLSPTGSGRRRTTSVSANSPTVITTDRVRPDWHQKLTAARAHTARRSAAATALHTAAYMMGNRHDSDGRAGSTFGRRGILRRTSGGGEGPSGTNSSQLNMLALMSERYAASNAVRGGEGEPTMTPGPRGSSRRNRVDDLEDMMMMEAIRLSLASEEDRRKREDKDAKKDAKKKEKENKKAEKAARKAGAYPGAGNQSTSGNENAFGEAAKPHGNLNLSYGKGKVTQQDLTGQSSQSDTDSVSFKTEDPQEHLERARAQILPGDGGTSAPYSFPPYRPSHLRTLSNASSSASSVDGSKSGSLRMEQHEQSSSFDVSPNVSGINLPPAVAAQETYISGTPPGGGAGLEPMFNFRSLAAMVGDDDKPEDAMHGEGMKHANTHDHDSGDSSDGATTNTVLENQDTYTRAILGESKSQMDRTINRDTLSEESGLQGFKIASSSELGEGSDEGKHPSVEIGNPVQERSQASS